MSNYERRCPDCGHRQHTETGRFCHNCGHSVPVIPPPPDPHTDLVGYMTWRSELPEDHPQHASPYEYARWNTGAF